MLREGLAGGVASFWEWLEADSERAGPDAYAHALRAFHEMARACPIDLPQWNPFGRLEDRWTNGEVIAEIGDELAGELRMRSEALSGSPLLWRDVQVIHGDAHAGNLLHCAGVFVWTTSTSSREVRHSTISPRTAWRCVVSGAPSMSWTPCLPRMARARSSARSCVS